MSKVDYFKRHVQLILEDELGVSVSQQKAWDIYKQITKGLVEFTVKSGDHELSISGIGKYRIHHSEPRGVKAGLDKDGKKIPGAKVWEYVPRFKYTPSTAIMNFIYDVLKLEPSDEVYVPIGIFRSQEEKDKKIVDELKKLKYEEKKTKKDAEETKPKKEAEEF